jgi:hypothetical protein
MDYFYYAAAYFIISTYGVSLWTTAKILDSILFLMMFIVLLFCPARQKRASAKSPTRGIGAYPNKNWPEN